MNSTLLLLLLVYSLCLCINSSATGSTQDQDSEGNSNANYDADEYPYSYYQIISSALSAVTAWNVLAVTLEVNDFRRRLQPTYHNNYPSNDNTPAVDSCSSSNSNVTLEQYIASLVAIRLGLRDAIVDWSIWYMIGYSIVAGFTWTDADSNTVLVIWGISVMVSAVIMAACALKVPQWLGFYRKSKLHLLQDTSNLAELAVRDLVESGGTAITGFRYQVRIGIGKHFHQFVFFLLPFYVHLQIWFFFLSILLGVAFGHAYLFVVFVCRNRFSHHRRRVTIGASVFFTIVSGIIFAYGLATIDLVWNWSLHGTFNFFQLSTIAWFGWVGVLLLIQAIQLYEQHQIRKHDNAADDITSVAIEEEAEGEDQSSGEDDPKLFLASNHFLSDNLPAVYERSRQQQHQPEAEDGEGLSRGTLQEPLLDGESSNSKGHEHNNQSSCYSSGHFDRVIKKEMAEMVNELSGHNESDHDGLNTGTTPYAVYQSLASLEQVNTKWHIRVWQFLPMKPSWDIVSMGCRSTSSCCDGESDFMTFSWRYKTWLVVRRILSICINLLAIYVAIICCGATYQIKVTKSKLPYIDEALYAHMNEGPVCAFDYKCGTLKTFPNEIAADLANATIAHCGACASCSSWNDLELQWSTKEFLSEKAQKCGTKTMFKGIDALQDCLEEDIGWTPPCALCWAEDIMCSKSHCIFIFLQSQMTNQIANFEVGPETITSATCEEANCEAGNPGDFVACSGSTRRRMNITSDINRPDQQQCALVGIPNSDWEAFFDQTMCRVED